MEQPEPFYSFRVPTRPKLPVWVQNSDRTPRIHCGLWKTAAHIATNYFKCGNDQFGLTVGLSGTWGDLEVLLIPDSDESFLVNVRAALNAVRPGSGVFTTLAGHFSDRATQLLRSGASISAAYINRAKMVPLIRLRYNSRGQMRWPERDRSNAVKEVLERFLDGSLTREVEPSARRAIPQSDKSRGMY